MRDISKFKCDISLYGGNELKKTYYIDGSKYMVKLPDPIMEKNKGISYVNNQFSEYLGSKIFDMFQIHTQEVFLAKINIKDKEKIAVACKDFLKDGDKLIEFKNLSISLLYDKKYSNDVLEIFEMINLLDNFSFKDKFKNYFYDVFVIDTLIGNVDRDLGNWALILRNGNYIPSPIYDCGSSLHPLINENEMICLLRDENEFKNIAINLKTAYKYNDVKMNYISFYELMPDELRISLKKIYPLINMEKIKELIYETEGLTDIQKEFYYKSILFRKKYILDKYYRKIMDYKN